MGCSNPKKQTQSCQLQSNFWLQLHHNSTTAISLPAPLQTPLLWACFCEARTHTTTFRTRQSISNPPTHSMLKDRLKPGHPKGILTATGSQLALLHPAVTHLGLTQAHKYASLTLSCNTALPALQSRHAARIPSHNSKWPNAQWYQISQHQRCSAEIRAGVWCSENTHSRGF